MRFKLTLFLLVANIFLMSAIWFLERKGDLKPDESATFIDFTELEISGKNIETPRVLKFKNNKWEIVSPINWTANFYAVSHIRNQLKFLNNEASFSADELKKHGQSLADYGLDDPIYTFKYGNGKISRELKIGKLAAVGNRIYMLDSASNKIIVADKSFVENLSANIDTLRGQNIFDIPQFEVCAFSIRLSDSEGSSFSDKSSFRRIGLVKNNNSWDFETPINAKADYAEVDAFIKSIISLSARKFESNPQNTGLDIASLPASITLQGTNRSQTLLLGKILENSTLQYARLEENPTVFLVDSRQIGDLNSLQTVLRSKSFFSFNENDLSEIEISDGLSSVKLKKLDSGHWDVVETSEEGGILSESADFAVVSSVIARLGAVRAKTFVSDSLGDDVSLYGFQKPFRKISVKTSSDSKTLILGNTFTSGKNKYTYAAIQGEKSVYGISSEILSNLSCDILGYKSRVLNAISESDKLCNAKLIALNAGKNTAQNFDLNAEKSQLKTLSTREQAAVAAMEGFAKNFRVAYFVKAKTSENSIEVDGKSYPFEFEFVVDVEQTGTGGVRNTQKKWKLTKRISGTLQYGVDAESKNAFVLTQEMIDAISALTLERKAPAIFMTPPPSAQEQKK